MEKNKLKRVVVKPYDKMQFEVWEDYTFSLPSISGTVPKGFHTDGASIPRIFWSLYPPKSPEYLSAAIIHDYLCVKASESEFKKSEYAKADNAFNEALKILEINTLKRWVFVASVKGYHKIKGFIHKWKSEPEYPDYSKYEYLI